jgi:nitrate/TMAO reductase-like tetraheme cytochrome c subunit
MKENEYECEVCHNVYEKGWTDEEAREEEADIFGENDHDSGIVCDDCFKKIMHNFN